MKIFPNPTCFWPSILRQGFKIRIDPQAYTLLCIDWISFIERHVIVEFFDRCSIPSRSASPTCQMTSRSTKSNREVSCRAFREASLRSGSCSTSLKRDGAIVNAICSSIILDTRLDMLPGKSRNQHTSWCTPRCFLHQPCCIICQRTGGERVFAQMRSLPWGNAPPTRK